jgi:hypothetical protein
MRFIWAALCALALVAGTLPERVPGAMGAAMADDDSSPGGGAGPGGDGGNGANGGSDPWSPFAGSKPPPRYVCRCQGFLGLQCSCRQAARRGAGSSANVQPRELLALGLDAEARARLEARGFAVRGVRSSVLLGNEVTRLAVPRQMSARQALTNARRAAPGVTLAANDIYAAARPSFRPMGTLCGANCRSFELTSWQADLGRCAERARIGVIDTGVDPGHPALRSSRLELVSIRADDRNASSKAHGTSVVSLLIGSVDGEFAGVAPGAQVTAVDAFYKGSGGDMSDAHDLIAALDALAERSVSVVNMSLSGPDNAFLQVAVAAMLARGTIIVAAAGTPDARAGYPGRYPGVIAVSAVDLRLRATRTSQRGSHIAFAAPGAGVTVAIPGGQYATVEGSSYAAPFVTAAYAMALHPTTSKEEATRRLVSGVRDLGPPGRDAQYGHGLIQYAGLPKC